MPASEPNFDARMVDWLYDELDPAEAKSFEKHLEANPAVLAEANALRRTREAFRDMDQSEPSVARVSMLMHEAAQAVAQSPSLWARLTAFMQPVFLHPAASAMATLVVVAGVAGALYSRNGDMSVQPTAAVSANESTADADRNAGSPAPPALPAATIVADEEAGADTGSRAQAQGLAEKDGYRVGLASDSAEDEIQAAEDSRREKRSQREVNNDPTAFASNWGSGDEFADDSGEKPARDKVPTAPLSRGTSGRGFASPPDALQKARPSTKGEVAKNSKVLRELSAEPKSRSKADAPGKGVGASVSVNQNKKKAEELSWEDEKTRVLNAAAKDKRCRDAGRIANDILDKKPSYYKQNVQDSKAVSDCGQYVASETQRRAKVRKQQAAKSRKKAAGTPKNAKAAPQDEVRTEALD